MSSDQLSALLVLMAMISGFLIVFGLAGLLSHFYFWLKGKK